MLQYLTIEKVAKRYDTSRDSIYRWLRNERNFPTPIELPSGYKRWALCDLEAWEASRKISDDFNA